MNRAMHSHLAPVTEIRAVENRSPGRNKYFILQRRAGYVSVRTHETVVSDCAWMPLTAADHSVFHHDALAADADRSTRFTYYSGPVQNARAHAYFHVAAHRRIGCNPS